MTIILFEDAAAAQLYPATLTRPAFAVSCGASRLIDLVQTLGRPVRAVVRPHLVATVQADYASIAVEAARTGGVLKTALAASELRLLVNARVVPSVAVRRELARIVSDGQPGVVLSGEQVAAAVLSSELAVPDEVDGENLTAWLAGLGLPALAADLPLLNWPHEIIQQHLRTLSDNLQQRVNEGNFRQAADGVFVADDVTLGAHLSMNTEAGPIVIECGAVVGPHCYLQGPVHIGRAARVVHHAALKDGVALGHTTKVGGEVEASIVEPYSNKQHFGFLGHSYLGSWINLGAGTSNSDLKNTYGEVVMQAERQRIATAMQMVGMFVGDYVKTAIHTAIFTGKTIGACSMLYGFVTRNVPSFVNYAHSLGQVTAVPVEVMIATQARMFARRNVAQRPCDIQLLHDLHALTRPHRPADLSSDPPAF